ncbi:MAG: 4Fe-4S ferredoxin [Firmicutes bacterium]|nr:4Fe-4S ferredoxin [Bacillota bacterium]
MSTNDAITQEMRKLAKELLEQKAVGKVIGWGVGSKWHPTQPLIISDPADAERLIWDDFAIAGTATYLLNERDHDHKIAIFVKGCDSRGVNRLIQDYQMPRERLVIIGIPCSGKKDPRMVQQQRGMKDSIPLAKKCVECRYHNPVIYDQLLGEPVDITPRDDRMQEIIDIENLTPDQKYQTFTEAFEKCIRCFACKNVCPACNCRDCIFDQTRPQWVDKSNDLSDNQMYHLIRAIHMIGRCVECGECERVCPQDVPLMLINKKLIKDVNQLFGPYDAGVDLEARPPLIYYKTEDPEEFH